MATATGFSFKDQYECRWDSVVGDSFRPATLQQLRVRDWTFQIVSAPSGDSIPDLTIATNLKELVAIPRPKAYRRRTLLVPRTSADGNWGSTIHRILDFITWSRVMDHLVTFSTFKSGGSHPHTFHGQGFPLELGGNGDDSHSATGLRSPAVQDWLEPVIGFGEMPHFENLRIEWLARYPAPGVRITYDDAERGPIQAARKLFEFAQTYDTQTAYNLVVVPRETKLEDSDHPAVYFFPRRRDGQAIYPFGGHRWQIAGLELAGLLQVRSPSHMALLTEDVVLDVFRRIRINAEDELRMRSLINSF